MNTTALYDLSPALRVMLTGLTLALGPLAWIWLRRRQASAVQRLQALTVLTLFLTFDLVLFGAFTRLTDSGLGCPDWPGCYGQSSPAHAHAQAEISAAQQALPSGPVTHGKAWVEMVHRYLATAVGVLILALALASWQAHARARRAADAAAAPLNPWWATLTLAWVCLQGAFGALTVTMKLFPAIVTLHLLGGVALLVLLCVQAVRYAQRQPAAAAVRVLPAALRRWLWPALGLLVLQLTLGGWVSTNYAVLACTEFPTCQGAWWPAMDFAAGFAPWRPLGLSASGEPISFAALTAIHYAHRLLAYGVFAGLGALTWALHRQPGWQAAARALALLLGLQLLSGLSNVVLGWPLPAALLHTGGAAALVLLLSWVLATSASKKPT